jgi:hypothetical protein
MESVVSLVLAISVVSLIFCRPSNWAWFLLACVACVIVWIGYIASTGVDTVILVTKDGIRFGTADSSANWKFGPEELNYIIEVLSAGIEKLKVKKE